MEAITITKARDFSRPQDYDAFSIVRLRNAHLKGLGGRHTWVKLESNGKRLYRRVRGAGNTGIATDEMEIDYDSRIELGINSARDQNGFHSCNVAVTQAGWLGAVEAHWHHPNIEYRVPYRMAMLGLMLGLLGALLGALSLFG